MKLASSPILHSHNEPGFGRPRSGGGGGLPPGIGAAIIGAMLGGGKIPGFPQIEVMSLEDLIKGGPEALFGKNPHSGKSQEELINALQKAGNKAADAYEQEFPRDISKAFPVFKPVTRVYRVRRGKLAILMETFEKFGGTRQHYTDGHHDHGVMYSIMVDPEIIENRGADVFLFEVVWQVGDLCEHHEKMIKLIRSFAEI